MRLRICSAAKQAAKQQDAASPITYAHRHFPPTLLIHGNADDIVPVEASFAMYRSLSEVGAPVELHVYDGAPHAFDALPEFGRQLTDIMALFLDRKVTNPRAVELPRSAALLKVKTSHVIPTRGSAPPGAHRSGSPKGSVARHMMRLSAYMIMGFLTMTIAQLIEAIYLGLVGTAELAAIAFTFPLVMSLNAAVRGIGIGASSVIARVIGAGDRAARRRAHDPLSDSRRGVCGDMRGGRRTVRARVLPTARRAGPRAGTRRRLHRGVARWFYVLRNVDGRHEPAALGRQRGDARHRDDGRFVAAGIDRTVPDLRLARPARARHRRRRLVVRDRAVGQFRAVHVLARRSKNACSSRT